MGPVSCGSSRSGLRVLRWMRTCDVPSLDAMISIGSGNDGLSRYQDEEVAIDGCEVWQSSF